MGKGGAAGGADVEEPCGESGEDWEGKFGGDVDGEYFISEGRWLGKSGMSQSGMRGG